MSQICQWETLRVGPCVTLTHVHQSVSTPRSFGTTRCSQLMVYFPFLFLQLLLQGALIPVSGEQHLETKIWVYSIFLNYGFLVLLATAKIRILISSFEQLNLT